MGKEVGPRALLFALKDRKVGHLLRWEVQGCGLREVRRKMRSIFDMLISRRL